MLRVVELFAGIGSQIQALKNLGIDAETVAISEIDKYAISAYTALHGETLNLGDITQIKAKDAPDCDLLTYSFPCQDISIAGVQRGLEQGSNTRSSLLWEVQKIIEKKRPKYLLMENVKNLLGPAHRKNFIVWTKLLEEYGYKNYYQVLNAVDYGVPQSRERLFMFSTLDHDQKFTFEHSSKRDKKLKDILEPKECVPDNLWMNDKQIDRVSHMKESPNGLILYGSLVMPGFDSSKRVYSLDGVCPTLTTMNGGNTKPKVYIPSEGVRKLTPKECWLAMGFTAEQFDTVKANARVNNRPLSATQLYKMAGNSICVPCLEGIFKEAFL